MAKVKLAGVSSTPVKPLYYTNVNEKGSVYMYLEDEEYFVDLTSGESSEFTEGAFVPLSAGQSVTIEV